LDVMLLKIEL